MICNQVSTIYQVYALPRPPCCAKSHRRIRGDLIQYYKIHHTINWVKLRFHFPSITTTGPASNIRGQQHRQIREPHHAYVQRDSFLCNRVLRHWNQLPSNIVDSKTTNEFKNTLDAYIKSNHTFLT